MPIYPGVSDSQKKVPPLPPSVASRSDSGSGRAFDNGATFLTFNPTVFDGKLPIIDYVITATAEDNATVTQTVSNLNSLVFTGLRSGVRYRYKIRARNSVSESVDSAEAGPDTATTVPGRPTSLTAINLSNGGGISLSWVAPPNAGKAITSYTITPTVGAPIVTNSTSTTYSFSGVVGTVYNFTVAATNENGTGINSTASGTVTPTPAPTPPPPPPTPVITGPTTGINSLSVSVSANGRGELVPTVTFSAFGYASWSFSAIGTSTGIINGQGTSGTPSSGPTPSQFCGQVATGTLVVYSGGDGTGTSATSTVNFTMPSSGTGCPTGTVINDGGGPATSTYWYTVCCKTGNIYAPISRNSPQSASIAAYFAEDACTQGGGTVQGGQQSYSVNAPTIPCAAPPALPCSVGNANCTTPTCAACDTTAAGNGQPWAGVGYVNDPGCPGTGRRSATVCWTGGSCPNTPNTGACIPGGTLPPNSVPPPSTSAIFVTTTFCPSLGAQVPLSGFPGNCPGAVQTCSGPCNGTWSVVNGVCRCTATPTPTPVPATPTPAPPGCSCRDFRGRCVSERFCGPI
jgi:hypothetical protein